MVQNGACIIYDQTLSINDIEQNLCYEAICIGNKK